MAIDAGYLAQSVIEPLREDEKRNYEDDKGASMEEVKVDEARDGTDQDDAPDEQKILNVSDPFPADPNAQPEDRQFTACAVLTGCCLGGLIAASNMYLGLKTG